MTCPQNSKCQNDGPGNKYCTFTYHNIVPTLLSPPSSHNTQLRNSIILFSGFFDCFCDEGWVGYKCMRKVQYVVFHHIGMLHLPLKHFLLWIAFRHPTKMVHWLRFSNWVLSLCARPQNGIPLLIILCSIAGGTLLVTFTLWIALRQR